MIDTQLKGILPKSIKQSLQTVRQVPFLLKSAYIEFTCSIHSAPILILGNQKSGTSAIAALLAEMTGLSLSLDLRKEIDRPTYHLVKKGELPFSEFVKINKLDFSREIVKEPNLTLFYEELADYFPQSKFVFVIRDPRDNIRSILNRLKIPGNLSQLEPQYCREMTPAWDLIVDNSWLGLKGENYIEMLAERWNYTADVFLKNSDQLILTCYEEFQKHKIGEIDRLAKKLELDQVNDISDKVDIQFQPRGNRNVKWHEFFGNDNLARIECICGERMNVFNYPITDNSFSPLV